MPLPARLLCFFLFFIFLFAFSSKALAFSITSVNPNTIDSPEKVVEATLNLDDLPNSFSYFRVAFTKTTDKPSYFGLIENNEGKWGNIGSFSDKNCPNYYRVESPSATNQITIKVKMGESKESGTYYLRAHRLTEGCNSSNYTDFISATYTGSSPSPSPSFSSSPTLENNSPQDYNNISVTEVYPAPNTGEDKEWIEVFNNSGNRVNLNGWYIEDEDGRSKTFSDFSMDNQSYRTFEFNSGFLNNNGDTVKLFNANKDLKFSLPDKYPEIQKGYSWSEVGDSWCQTEKSPQQSNSSCLSFDSDSSGNSDSSDSSSPSPTKTTQTATTTTTNKQPTSAYKKESASSEEMLLDEQEIEIGEILGATESGEEEEKEEEEEEKEKPFLAPLFISGAGLLMLGGASFPFVKPKVVELIERWRKNRDVHP